MGQQNYCCQLTYKILNLEQTVQTEQRENAGQIMHRKEWHCKTNWDEETLGSLLKKQLKRQAYEDQSKDKRNLVWMEKLNKHSYQQPNIYWYILLKPKRYVSL